MKPRFQLRLVFALIAGVVAMMPATIAAQVPRPQPKPIRSQATRPSMAESQRAQGAGRVTRSALAPTATLSESEPNDSIPDADAVAVGDTVSGVIDPTGDVDWYAFEVATDTTIVLDVLANRAGSYLDPVMFLYAPADTGVGFVVIQSNDDYNDLDSFIRIHVAAGRYYAALVDYYGAGGSDYTYALRISFQPTGPGDPTTLYASGLGSMFGVAAGRSGELYSTDLSAVRRVLRIDPAGTVTPFASLGGTDLVPLHVVVDGVGNVLVTAEQTNGNYGTVQRIIPGGAVSTFASGFHYVNGITVGPDGDVWLIVNNDRPALLRLDPAGARKDSIDITAANARYYGGSIAFSPDGVLHFTNGFDGVFKLVNRTAQRVISGEPYIESLAFDRDGYLYVSNGSGYISLYDPTYALVSLTFATTNLDQGHVMYLAFGRDGSGAMTSRLFATNSPLGKVFELNPQGMRSTGFRVGTDLLAITPASLPAGTMGAEYSFALAVQSPPGPPTWSISAGALPGDLTLNASTGVLSGVFTTSGSFTFTVRVSAGGVLGYNGYTLSVSRPELLVAAAADHLLAGAQLDPAVLRFLDFQGNNNGHYDVGDFRAYLRAGGPLPDSVSARRSRP
jgi:hypothetical protein